MTQTAPVIEVFDDSYLSDVELGNEASNDWPPLAFADLRGARTCLAPVGFTWVGGRGNRRRYEWPNEYVFKPVWASASEYRREAADRLHEYAATLPSGKQQRRWRKRAAEFRQCGRWMITYKCQGCGELAPGLGLLKSSKCHLRICPSCERARGRRLATSLVERMATLPREVCRRDGQTVKVGPKFWTFTTKYDPTDPAEVTPDALSLRVSGLLDALAKLWVRQFRPMGFIAMFVRTELGNAGAVHAHAILWGPFVPERTVDAINAKGARFYERFGHSAPRAAREVNGIAFELAKYCTKSPGSKSEDWLAGRQRPCMDPELAVRWEIATARMHLQRSYGAFRSISQDEEETADTETVTEEETGSETVRSSEARSPEERQRTLSCPCCGLVGRWQQVEVRTESAIRALHARGFAALWGSRWKPRENGSRGTASPEARNCTSGTAG